VVTEADSLIGIRPDAANALKPGNQVVTGENYLTSPHGGGSGGFRTAANPGSVPACNSNNYGPGTFPSNPMPQTETVNALRFHFRNWVMNGKLPPPSVYPKLNAPGDDDDDGDDDHGEGRAWGRQRKGAQADLVAPNKRAMGVPEGIPAILASATPNAPNDFVMAMLQYDWGHDLDYSENIGFHDFEPPIVRRVIKQVVPRTDADGNEIGGVPVVLRDAPLGTYLGWNVTAAGVNRSKVCNYQGGWIPFELTRAARMAKGDPRLSLEERYGTHDNYVRIVTEAANRIMAHGFLLEADRDALVAAAAASKVLK